MPRVFISYRHADSQSATGFLHGWLEKEFGKDQVFLDTSDIVPGEEFREAIWRFIRTADVMLIVIGSQWLNAVRDGQRRLDDPNDLLRQEIEWGLEANIPIIPVLIDGVSMPRAHELPRSLRPLTGRTAFAFARDVPVAESIQRLVDLIWTQSGRRRPLVRRPRLLAFHAALIVLVVSTLLALAGQAGLLTIDIPLLTDLRRALAGPQAAPRIVSFLAESPVVVLGAPLTVRWTVEGANTCALYVDGVQVDLRPAETTQAILTLDTLGSHELALVASQGERSARAILLVRVDEALQIRRFAADPSVLTRYIGSDVALAWDVAGATQVRLDGLAALTGQMALSSFPPQGSHHARLHLEEQTVITLEATSASGQVLRQPLLLRVQDPFCLVSADQGPVYDGPGGSGALLEWRAMGEIVFPDRRNADGTWLRVHMTGGRHVWMPAAVLDCRTFTPVDLPVAEE